VWNEHRPNPRGKIDWDDLFETQGKWGGNREN
jgi:hypothetical protein